MERRTKIVCTIGPKTQSKEMIERLCDAGMNVARLNFSHGTHEGHKTVINTIKDVRKKFDRPIGILLDTKGPEIRIGKMEEITVAPKTVVRLVSHDPKRGEILIHPGFIVDDVKVGVQVLIDDGYVRGKIIAKGSGWADLEIENHGLIKGGKGVNIPSQLFDLPDMTDQDLADIEFGCKEGVDIIAASFINTPKQLLAIREHIQKCGGKGAMLIAKIETKQGVKNFDDILEVADGIMIARGDLGVELFVGDVPPLQKKMVRACNLKAKPVIIATQMLESMIKNPMPTRAEASDVANAIYDSGSAVMLSGETAVGDYPDTAVRIMDKIIVAAEKDFDNRAHFDKLLSFEFHDIPSAMARAAVNTAFHIGASAIFACSNSGNTIRHICRYRPRARVIAVTPSEKTFYQTALMWGTECYREKKPDVEKGLSDISAYALKRGWVKYGDPIVITLGKPYGVSYTTNTITVESVGNVLVRGHPMEEIDVAHVCGKVKHLLSVNADDCHDFDGKVVVVSRFEEGYTQRLKGASAVIMQNHPYDTLSEEKIAEFSKRHQVPYITRAEGASTLLIEGDKVRVYPSCGLVFHAKSPTEAELLSRAD